MKNERIIKIKSLDYKQLSQIIEIIKNENTESIISNLKRKTLKKFISGILISKNYNVFLLIVRNRVVGYIIIKKAPNYSNYEIYKISYLIELLYSLNLILYFNLLIKFFNLDKILFKNFEKKIYLNSINISYLGINKKFQSSGYGKKLLKFAIKKTNFKSNFVSVETMNSKAGSFYEKKCKFRYLNKKIQFFNFVKVYFIKKKN